jgi:hypothetical protein
VAAKPLVVDFTSNMAEASATLPSSLIATDCPNVVTVTTKAKGQKFFHNYLSYFIILLLDLILYCDSSLLFHDFFKASHTDIS